VTTAIDALLNVMVLAKECAGAFQADVYQALHERGVEPAHVIGTSAGAINSAIIAGNTPAVRIAVLPDVWHPPPTAMSWPRC
jgi:NTE family protein